MALTLAEANKYSSNMVRRGVIEEIIKDSVFMQKLPFIEVTGNAYQYLRETTQPTVAFYNPNELIAENTGDVTQYTASIKIMLGDADVDNFLKATRSNYTDLTAETIQSKSKAMRHTFMNGVWYGDSAVDTRAFDGLHKIFAGADMANQKTEEGSGSTPSALNATNLDSAMDLVKGGVIDCAFTTRAARRRIHQYLRGKANIDYVDTKYGLTIKRSLAWGGVPIEHDDHLVDTELLASGTYSAKTGGASTSLFGLTFGTNGLLGLQNGSLQTQKMGQVDNKDAMRYRIRWYPSIAMLRSNSAMRVGGIDTATAMVD